MEYAVFADERRYDHGRFRSIAAVSLPAGTVVDLSTRLAGALATAGVTELKWSGLGARAAVVRCATAFVHLLLEEIPNGLRADVVDSEATPLSQLADLLAGMAAYTRSRPAANGYLRTADPKQPINFWHYQPQHPADKAPVAPCLQTGALV